MSDRPTPTVRPPLARSEAASQESEDLRDVGPEEVLPPLREPQSEPARDSLQARMKARQAELAQQTTEVFPVPRYEEMLGVELRQLTGTEVDKIMERNTQHGSARQTTIFADELIAATVGFYEISNLEAGEMEPIEEGTWQSICSGIIDLPNGAGGRVALVTLVGALNVPMLHARWRNWCMGNGGGLIAQTMRDFKRTP